MSWWGLYAKGGALKYCYNWGGFKHLFVEATSPLPAGDHQVRMEFAYAGGGLGKGGKATCTPTARRSATETFLVDPEDAIRVALARQ